MFKMPLWFSLIGILYVGSILTLYAGLMHNNTLWIQAGISGVPYLSAVASATVCYITGRWEAMPFFSQLGVGLIPALPIVTLLF